MTPIPDIASADLVRAIEAQYDLRVTTPPRSLPPGFHSRAWLVDTMRGTWVVKLSNPSSDPLSKLEHQIQLANYLNQHGICAPQIFALRNGRFIATLTIDDLPYPLQLMQYQLLSQVQPEGATDTTLAMVGELIARLHQILNHYPGGDVFIADHHNSANQWGARDEGLWPLLDAVPDRDQLSLEDQAWLRTIDQHAVAFVQQQFPDPAALSMALLHGDLNFEHIRFLPDGTPYLFDFGDMCWGPIAHELAVLFLNVYCDSDLSFAHWETIQQHIVHGYQVTGQLTSWDETMITVFIVNRIVARAEYAVELAHEERMAIDWKTIKRTYELAEYLMNHAAGT